MNSKPIVLFMFCNIEMRLAPSNGQMLISMVKRELICFSSDGPVHVRVCERENVDIEKHDKKMYWIEYKQRNENKWESD